MQSKAAHHARKTTPSIERQLLNTFKNKSVQKQRIKGGYQSSVYRIESFVFQDGSSMDATQINEAASVVYGTNGKDTLASSAHGDTLLGFEGDDKLTGGGDGSVLDGGDGNDTLIGSRTGNNTLLGGAGNDNISVSGYSSTSSNNSDNIFEGGAGNDILRGGFGDDEYRFNIGDGQDTLTDYRGTDKIVFGEGFTQNHLRLSHPSSGSDLWIELLDDDGLLTGDRIVVKGGYQSSVYRIESFVFQDGSSMDATQINEAANNNTSIPLESSISSEYLKIVDAISEFSSGEELEENMSLVNYNLETEPY